MNPLAEIIENNIEALQKCLNKIMSYANFQDHYTEIIELTGAIATQVSMLVPPEQEEEETQE